MADNAKSKKGRVVILVYNMLSQPVLHFYQIPSRYSKGYSSYRADINSTSKTKQRERTPKVRKPLLSFLHATRSCSTFLPSTIKIFRRVFTLQSEHKIKFKQGEIMQKVRNPQLPFLCVTHRLVLFYTSTKIHKNIPKGIRLTDGHKINA